MFGGSPPIAYICVFVPGYLGFGELLEIQGEIARVQVCGVLKFSGSWSMMNRRFSVLFMFSTGLTRMVSEMAVAWVPAGGWSCVHIRSWKMYTINASFSYVCMHACMHVCIYTYI